MALFVVRERVSREARLQGALQTASCMWLEITNACTCIDDVVVYVGPGRVEVQCCISSDLRTAVLVVLVDTPTAAPVAEALCVVGKQRTVVRLQ